MHIASRALIVILVAFAASGCRGKTTVVNNTTVEVSTPTGPTPIPTANPEGTITATPQTLKVGEQVSVLWVCSSSDSAEAQGNFKPWADLKNVEVQGSKHFTASEVGSFTVSILCKNISNTILKSATFTVKPTDSDGNGGGNNGDNHPLPTCTLNANRSVVPFGGGQVVFTIASANANSVVWVGTSTSLPLNGTVTENVTARKSFQLSCSGAGGTSTSNTITIDVQSATAPSCSLSVSASSINMGNSVTLTWVTQGASQVTGSWTPNSLTLNGSTTVFPTTNTTYFIRATGPGGSCDSSRVTVVVNGPACPAVTSYAPAGGNIKVNQTLTLTVQNWPSNSSCKPFWYTDRPDILQVNGSESVTIDGKVFTAGVTANLKAIWTGTAKVCVQPSIVQTSNPTCYNWISTQ